MDIFQFMAKRESHSINRKIKKLIERLEKRLETEKCLSDDELNKFLFNIDFYLKSAEIFNESYDKVYPEYAISIGHYKARINKSKGSNMCYESIDS